MLEQKKEKLAIIMAKLKGAGAEYNEREVAEYAASLLNLTVEELERQPADEIIRYIQRALDIRYKGR